MHPGARSWPKAAVLLVLLPVLLGAGGTQKRALTFDPASEGELLALINDSRARNGLRRLELNPSLTEAARAHALKMAQQEEVTHRFAQEPELRLRIAATALRFNFVGENVGRGIAVPSLHEEFLGSPGHRENILQPAANAVGVGAVRTQEYLWVTEDFAHVVPDYEPAQVEQLVAGGIGELRKPERLSWSASPALREEACDMARRDSVEFAHGASPAPHGTQQTVAYTTADPALLPEVVRRVATGKQPEKFSVGACFGRTASYPSGGYWIVVVFYFP